MSSIDRQVGIGDPEIDRPREQLDASAVERLANEYLPPHEAQRKALITLLDGLGYGAAAAIIRAGVKGGYFVVNAKQAHAAVDLLDDATEYAPSVILFCEDISL